MSPLQIALLVYGVVLLADVLDSRARCGLSWPRSLAWAPFWPLTVLARLLGKIGR